MRSISTSNREEGSILSDRRGFFSIDAFFALLLVITVATSLMTVSQRNKEAARETSGAIMQDMVAEELAAGINSVYANGSGLKIGEGDNLGIYISLPDNILGENYTLSLNEENRLIVAENSKAGLQEPIATASIIPHNIHDFVLKPENLSHRIRIFWEENKIRVRSCLG